MARLYTKKVWLDDQTKLSAKNLNHIEKGVEAVAEAIDEIEAQGNVHTHNNKSILDATTEAFTTELKEKYDAVENQLEAFKDKAVIGTVEVSSGTLTIGNTTITEEQLKQLLAQLQVQG